MVPRARLLQAAIFALTKQQRAEQRQLRKAAEKAAKSAKKKGRKQAKGVGVNGGERQNSTLIKQMVDNILREGEEVGHSSSNEDDGDLSGDEVKTPVFVIRRADAGAEEESKGGEMMDEGEVDSEEGEQFFVQDEYDLAHSVDQMVTRMDAFDEYKHLRELATQCHQQNAPFF